LSRRRSASTARPTESQVTVISPDIGGGFGQKIALYREVLTVAALARALRRRVRWREDRNENLIAAAVNASAGLMASGQGYETTFAQVVAQSLGVDPDDVQIQIGNTDTAPYGMGSRGARGGTAGGSVLLIAAEALRDKVLTIAATLLGLNTSGELRLNNRQIERRLGGDWTDAGLSLADIAHVAYLDPLRLPPGMEPGLEIHRAYDPPPMTFSNATHICEILVDVQACTSMELIPSRTNHPPSCPRAVAALVFNP
jgi:CO/xanthine dehydrogenase Mo-binding subunit